MHESFHLFAYGTLKDPQSGAGVPADLLAGCERVDTGVVRGCLYDAGDYPVLLLSGDDQVPGVIWRCPADRLQAFDRYEGVAEGLFRRTAVKVGQYACWVYVAGPRLGARLVPEARIRIRPS